MKNLKEYFNKFDPLGTKSTLKIEQLKRKKSGKINKDLLVENIK